MTSSLIVRGWWNSCATLYLRHVIDAYANYYFWDEMQFWILQFCQTRFWSVTIFRFMMSHHLWVTISDSPLWLILFSSFSTRLKLYILSIFNLQVYLHWIPSKVTKNVSECHQETSSLIIYYSDFYLDNVRKMFLDGILRCFSSFSGVTVSPSP